MNTINKIFYASTINLENMSKKRDEIFFTLLNNLKLMKSNKIIFYNLFNNINNWLIKNTSIMMNNKMINNNEKLAKFNDIFLWYLIKRVDKNNVKKKKKFNIYILFFIINALNLYDFSRYIIHFNDIYINIIFIFKMFFLIKFH